MNLHVRSEPHLDLPLRGRRNELEALRDVIDDVRGGRGGTVLITGPAGMGKTALLDAVGHLAGGYGIRVFRGTSDAATQAIPLGPLLEALVSAQNAPVDPALLRDLSQSPDQRFWLLRELQESLERAALHAPVLISIDDVQWADAATLAALGTLPRQLATHRILWLLAARSTDLSGAARGALNRLEAAGARKIALDLLDRASVAEVAEDLLGGTPDAALLQVLGGVRGQPFLLTELLRGMREEKSVQVDDGVARLTGTRIPLRFVDSVKQQLARLSVEAYDVLQMACVLGRRFSADELAELVDTTPAAILGALREALAAGLIAEDGDRVAFRHDLVREAVDATLPKTVKRCLRRRAIDVMLQNGAPPSDVADHVLEVAQPGDADAIAILRRAAAETGRVSPTVAGTLSRRALDLAPRGDPSRGPLTAETLAYLVHAGKAAEAVGLMTAAPEDLVDPAAEAEARLSLAMLSMQYNSIDVVEQSRRGLSLSGVPVTLRTQLQSFLALGLDLCGDVDGAGRAVQDAIESAKSSGDPVNEVVTLLPRATQALARGNWREAVRLIDEALAGQAATDRLAVRLWLAEAWKALFLILLARLDEAFALIDAGLNAAQQAGVSAHLRIWSMVRCRAMFAAGHLADARSDAEATIEMADEIGDGSYGYINHVCLYILGRVALHTGDPAGVAQARRSAARLCEAQESPFSRRLGAWLMALAADADGDPVAAAQPGGDVLGPLGADLLSASNPRMYADSATLTRILLDAGRRAEAKDVVARVEGFSAQHPDFPMLECAALHARAILDSDPDTALRAVACSELDSRPLVRAAVLEDAGRLLPDARAGEAVPLLESALAAYTQAGAERDASRVRSLLRARGVRPAAGGPRSAPDWPELTESEFAVVGLVARGATNREVAERLYLSPYTVNTHLRHVFAKLGIRSRVELAHLAAARGISAEHP
jgi:DNA-binding NarL/FixJ family response regulator